MHEATYYQKPEQRYRDPLDRLVPLKLEDIDDDETGWIEGLKDEEETESSQPKKDKSEEKSGQGHKKASQ